MRHFRLFFAVFVAWLLVAVVSVVLLARYLEVPVMELIRLPSVVEKTTNP